MFEPVCTLSSLAADEPLVGSAPHARAWVCLEQPGPWGAQALTQSHLDPALGAEIERRAGAAGVRPALIRRPGRHADEHHRTRPTVLVAHTDPADPWLCTGVLDSAERLLDLDWAALARGERPLAPELAATHDPQLLVCTNGARDTCCARLGRPVVADAAAAYPRRVWEVTHTSGHRFAPTTVLLPSGHLHGRIDDGPALLAAADTGRLVSAGWRGRSTWPAPAQVAEEAVRRELGLTGIDDVVAVDAVDDPDGSEDDQHWTVRHHDGRSWRVRTHEVRRQVPRAASCGKEPKPWTRVEATVVGGLVSEA